MRIEKTRALWVDFESSRRKTGDKPSKALIRECERFWARLNAGRKRRFLRALPAYIKARNSARKHEASGSRWDDVISQLDQDIGPGTDWLAYMQQSQKCATAWKTAEGHLQELQKRLQKLRQALASFRGDDGNPATRIHPDLARSLHDEYRAVHERITVAELAQRIALRKADNPPIPNERLDGKLKLPKDWISKGVLAQRDESRMAVSKRDGPEPQASLTEHDWRGPWIFADGAMSTAGLWVDIDGSERVQDRIVRKDTHLDDHEWCNIQRWAGEIRDPRNREPYEIACHRILSGAQSDQLDAENKYLEINVPRFRTGEVSDARKMYTLTMEYCGLKSLDDLILAYRKKNREAENGKEDGGGEEEDGSEGRGSDGENDGKGEIPAVGEADRESEDGEAAGAEAENGKSSAEQAEGEDSEGEDDCDGGEAERMSDEVDSDANTHKIPEPFIWHTFRCLAEVGLAMEQGHARRNLPPNEDHQQIIHRDLKPSNVFLAEPRDDIFASYPISKVGDFGLSFMTAEDDLLNPSTYNNGAGTDGWIAPEQAPYVSVPDMDPIDDFKMLAHTNVWAVGMVIWSMAALDPDPKQPVWLGTGEQPEEGRPSTREIKGYSWHLKKLVGDCIQFDPAKRPTWIDVLGRIDRALDLDDLDLVNDLEIGDAVASYDPNYLEFLPRDSYAIGLSSDKLPPVDKSSSEEDLFEEAGGDELGSSSGDD